MILILLNILIVESLIIKLIQGFNYNIHFTDMPASICIVFNSIIAIIIFLLQKREKNGVDSFNSLITLSYILRVALLFFDRYFSDIFTLPNSGADSRVFDNAARSYVENGITVGKGYSTVLGWIYKLFYPDPLWGQYLNVIASIFTIIVVYKILCNLNIEKKYKLYGVLIICFIPNYLIMSAILLRESFITLLLAIAIYQLLEWWDNNCWKSIIISIICTLGAAYLHSGTIAYAVAILIVVAFAGNSERKFKFKPATVLVCLVGVMLFMFVYNKYGDTFFSYMGGLSSAEDVVNHTELYSTGGSAYSASIVDDNSMLGLIINSPIRIFYFLASPLPWNWRGLSDIIGFIGSGLFYITSTFLGFKAIYKKECKNKNMIILMLIIALCSSIIYSWGVANAGTALRHRDKFIVNFTLILVLSLDVLDKYKKVKLMH